MRTLLPDPPPVEFEALLERRRSWGADTHDEVWEGVLHVNPAPHGRHAELQAQLIELLGPLARVAGLKLVADFNLGKAGDYRVPDGGLHRPGQAELYYSTAALVIEVLSPEDETWAKLPFYAAHGVDEVLIVDPDRHSVDWLGFTSGKYQPIGRSALVELGVEELAGKISWPS